MTEAWSPEEDRAFREAAGETDATPHLRVVSEDGELLPQPARDGAPAMPRAAFHGVAGRLVEIIKPHSEADPNAILLQFLAAAGNSFGRGPHVRIEGDTHSCNLFVTIVGDTSSGRKGTSWGRVRQVFKLADNDWVTNNVAGGLASGEGLIWAVRDPIFKMVAEKDEDTKKPTGNMVEELVDGGVEDKRLLVQEAEMSRVLRAMKKEGNILSAVIRELWDTGDCRSMSKNNPGKTTGAMVSVVAHSSADELRRELTDTDAANGFGNRFLWVLSFRSKLLPRGGNLTDRDLEDVAGEIRQAQRFAASLQDEPLDFDQDAWRLWESGYERLTIGQPGLAGSILARGAPQVRRLSLIYALLDLSGVIRVEHLRAALAVWSYCEQSVWRVFGDASGDPDADKALKFISEAGKQGRDGAEMWKLWANHKDPGPILDRLERGGGIWLQKETTSGRTKERWISVAHRGESESSE